MRSLPRIALVLLLLLATLLAAGAAAAWRELNRGGPAAASVRLEVAAGASVRSVLTELAAIHALRRPRLAEWYARLQRPPIQIKPGSYQIAAHASPLQILEQLRAGRILLEQITIIEGWSFAQMRKALDADRSLSHPWRGLDDAQLMAALGQQGVHPEGRFFPDTYHFAAGTPDRRIYELAHDRMSRELAKAWAGRAAGLPLATDQELLILASIVEKETGRDDERSKVAAVFTNRLRRGMRLQSDPTVIYGLGAAYDGDIRSRDLVTDTPYNTYTRAGLPPTPIALPGAASLWAATHPDKLPALYFVATGNGDGSHYFSTTLSEHNAAVQRFLKKTRAAGRTRTGATR